VTPTTSSTEAAAKISTPRYPEPPEWVDVVAAEEDVEEELVFELADV
jgi:hypothetical protein